MRYCCFIIYIHTRNISLLIWEDFENLEGSFSWIEEEQATWSWGFSLFYSLFWSITKVVVMTAWWRSTVGCWRHRLSERRPERVLGFDLLYRQTVAFWPIIAGQSSVTHQFSVDRASVEVFYECMIFCFEPNFKSCASIFCLFLFPEQKMVPNHYYHCLLSKERELLVRWRMSLPFIIFSSVAIRGDCTSFPVYVWETEAQE